MSRLRNSLGRRCADCFHGRPVLCLELEPRPQLLVSLMHALGGGRQVEQWRVDRQRAYNLEDWCSYARSPEYKQLLVVTVEQFHERYYRQPIAQDIYASE